jgi:glycosyltransferase involved in cell wall biosynthesis
MACGKPVLAGNKDGSVDTLSGGELGALVDPDNVDEIADALIQILRGTYPNPLMYQPAELCKKVIEKFGFERFSETLRGYLGEFLGKDQDVT